MRNFDTGPLQEPTEIKSLYKGVWADKFQNDQELPVGGRAVWSKELDLKLKLDFENFSEQLAAVNEEAVKKRFEENKAAIIDWLKQVGSSVDPYLFFVANYAQAMTHKLLEISADESEVPFARSEKFSGGKTPLLSELKGISMCAERAALGKHVLDKAGFESSYVGGITMADAKDNEEFPEAHSFIVMKAPADSGTYIFDIARPRSQHNLPRLLKTAVPFTYELLAGKTELLVKAKEALHGGELWFGVGEPVAGQHDLVE